VGYRSFISVLGGGYSGGQLQSYPELNTVFLLKLSSGYDCSPPWE